MSPLSALLLVFASLLLLATLREVYRVGQTLNDHFVAAVVTGCFGLYGVLMLGGLALDEPGGVLLAALGWPGLWALFWLLSRDGAASAVARVVVGPYSQLAFAFALWAGLVVILRTPWVLWQGGGLAEVSWPGAWLWLPAGLAVFGTWPTYRGHTVRAWQVPLPPQATPHPLRVVHLSDTHTSPVMHQLEYDEIIAEVEALDPDLVFLTGDLVMPFSEEEHQVLLDFVRGLPGRVFCCAGNHDLPVLDTLRRELAQAGAPMLVDEAVRLVVHGVEVEVVGAAFHWQDGARHLAEGVMQLPSPGPETWRVLMLHDPAAAKGMAPGRFDLVLSGHTHGGQIGLTGFGIDASVLRVLGARDQGWFPAGDGLQYVHCGNWFTGLPPRMGIPPEITLIRAVPGAPSSPLAIRVEPRRVQGLAAAPASPRAERRFR